MRVNIPKSSDDLFMRYKRDVIEINYFTKKGGITQLLNIEKIAKEIYTETPVLLAFIQKNRCTSKPMMNSNGIFLQGMFSVEVLEKIIEEFIEKIVICSVCQNPEYSIEEGKKYCKACGNIS